MAGFVGAIVQITLKQPAGAVVQGRVREVIPGQALHLEDVYFPQSGTHWPHWVIQNNIIADLDIIRASVPSELPAVSSPAIQQTSSQLPSQAPPSQHVDPAILSYDRTPARQTPRPLAETATPTSAPVPAPTFTLAPAPAPAPVAQTQHKSRGQSQKQEPQSIMTQAFTTLQVAEVAETVQRDVKRKVKPQRQRIPKPEVVAAEPPLVINTEVSRNGNDMNGAAKRGKGWRQTPLLQPTPAEVGQSKKRRKQRQIDGEAQNGWATEDATDIQDLGEFDFEANHKLFDKQQVWEQLRKDDTTADEDRLVSHNKLPPRKNLLPSEMVLSPKVADGSDADTEIGFQTGRSSSRHSTTKRQASRANSGFLESRPHPLSASVSSDRGVSRSVTSSRSKPPPVHTGNIGKSNAEHSPRSAVSHKSRSMDNVASSESAHFVMRTSRTLCPVLLPPALETLEVEATSQYGLSADAITELAARCIAEETLSMIGNAGDIRRPSRSNTARGGLTASTNLDDTTSSVVVVLAGNHSTGARAVAAARHLVGRKHTIIIAEGHFEAAAVQDQHFAKQLQLVKKVMRAGAKIKRGQWRKANNYIKNLSGPPVAIVDALFAGTTYDDLLTSTEELSATALEEARQMIDWANRSRAPVISITAPSGVSGFDGSAAIVDGEPLAVRPDKVLALGAPVTGILEAMKGGEAWDVRVADIGINIALKSEDAVQFGAQWVASLQYEQ